MEFENFSASLKYREPLNATKILSHINIEDQDGQTVIQIEEGRFGRIQIRWYNGPSFHQRDGNQESNVALYPVDDHTIELEIKKEG